MKIVSLLSTAILCTSLSATTASARIFCKSWEFFGGLPPYCQGLCNYTPLRSPDWFTGYPYLFETSADCDNNVSALNRATCRNNSPANRPTTITSCRATTSVTPFDPCLVTVCGPKYSFGRPALREVRQPIPLPHIGPPVLLWNGRPFWGRVTPLR